MMVPVEHPVDRAARLLRTPSELTRYAEWACYVRLGVDAADALAAWKAEMLAAIDAVIQGYDPKRRCHAIDAASEMLDRAREARAKLLPPEPTL